MKKLFILLSFVIFGQVSFGQVYQLMPQYGYEVKRMSFDSTLQIPTTCGVPTLKSVYNVKRGAIAFDSCNNRFYTYNPKTTTWSYLGSGGTTDTTSLSNRINQRIDSIKRSGDSIFARKNGVFVFQYKDSVGGSQSLQQVTDVGNTTTNDLVIDNGTGQTKLSSANETQFTGDILTYNTIVNNYFKIRIPTSASTYIPDITANDPNFGGNYHLTAYDSTTGKPKLNINEVNKDWLNMVEIGTGSWFQLTPDKLITSKNGTNTNSIEFKNTSSTNKRYIFVDNGLANLDSVFVPISVNNNYADANGNITINIPTANNLIDSLKRSTDSVFAKKNGSWIFQYKDSIGGGSGFVPYTGATQDVDLGTNKISAHSVYITGTNGNGHLHLKHQASDATATGQSTALFADVNGDLKWKNDGNYYSTLLTSNQTANRVYTYQNKSYTLGDSADISARVKYTDTASMLTNYQLKTPSVAYLNADFTTTNTTATSTNLTIPVEANTAYRIMISGSASKATSSTGMKISIGAPTGTTIKATASLGSNAISTIVNSFITTINTLGSTFATGVGVEVPFRVEGILVTGGTSGSITLQGATVTSNTATIYANTLMTITKAYAQ